MCGIVGYIGKKQAVPILIEGLKRLEYRGYDSVGTAVLEKGRVSCVKVKGKIADLERKFKKINLVGRVGLGHTRWATHGEPSEMNAHPHWDCSGEIMVVHNGIIENYTQLKKKLQKEGHQFRSETDTEVLAHLIEKYYRRDPSTDSGRSLEEATRKALSCVIGTYGIAVISKKEPNKIIVARMGSPIVLGVGEGETFVASDVSALLPYTKNVVYLDDGEMASLDQKGFTILDLENNIVEKSPQEISWTQDQAEKKGFAHFMLKEIFEQPETIQNTTRGRLLFKEGKVKLGGPKLSIQEIKELKKIVITACGTSYYAGLTGEYLLEKFTQIPVEVEYASEFRYRDPILDKNTLVIAISQSGETADTLAAVREAKRKGAKTLGIVNVVGSTIAREVESGVYIHAGPEIGVASTKAFSAQVIGLILLALWLGQESISKTKRKEIISAINKLPDQIKKILAKDKEIKKLARIYKNSRNFLFLGRGYNFPVALEGALKLKEISYIHAEGYPAAEMKHGPIALIDKDMPVVFVAIKDSVYDKIMSNIEEVKARSGKIIAIATEGDEEIKKKADHIIYIPHTLECLTPLLTVVPLQLLAYHIAVLRGCHVDQPRNLAKSVTVE